VAAGRHRRPNLRSEQRALARLQTVDRRAQAVPVDRVSELVQPVVREREAAPWLGPGVLELDAGGADRSGLRGLDLVGEPADAEGAGGDVVDGNCLHSGG